MKSPLLLSLAVLLSATSLFAQVPQGMNYQAVVRNGSGGIMPNQLVAFRFSIISGSSTGLIEYRETHTATTNELGLVNLVIGEGTPVNGTFAGINWGGASHWLDVELDPSLGGIAYQSMGTSRLMSVPYALNAGNSSTSMAQLTDVDVSGVVNGQVLKWNGATWAPANDADAQTLSIQGNNLSISGGNTVALPDAGLQDVQTNNTLSGNGTSGSPLGIIPGQPGQVLSTDGSNNVVWRIPAFLGGGLGFLGTAPLSWEILDVSASPAIGTSAVVRLLMRFYTRGDANTIYLRSPGITNQNNWSVIDIPADRSTLISVQALNGQIEWYGSSGGTVGWEIVGVIR